VPNLGEFAVAIVCPHCGQVGSAIWRKADAADKAAGLTRKLVILSAGFHTEEGRAHSEEPAIICDRCDQILGR